MKKQIVLSGAVLVGAAILAGQMQAVGAKDRLGLSAAAAGDDGGIAGGNSDGNGGSTTCGIVGGPDVIVGGLGTTDQVPGISNYSAANISGVFYESMSTGTTSCNIGNQQLLWIETNNRHPVIGQSMYRYRLQSNGVSTIEQIGQSWLKHGFFALSENHCGCGCSPTNGTRLGVGCSDPYNSTRNGTQTSLGPKWQVNAYTGSFTYPPANPSGATATTVSRRMHVPTTELELATPTLPSTPGSKYFVEGQYVTFDDAQAQRHFNNASHRRLTLSGSGTAWTFGFDNASGSDEWKTHRERSAIRAWQDNDPSVTEVDVFIAGEGLFVVAYDVTQLDSTTWHYEYAVYNMNSDRSGQSFSVPIGSDLCIENPGFKDVHYWDGDGISNANRSGTDWSFTNDGASVTWATETYTVNQNANAIRWGTTYNFRFDANAAPVNATATLGLFTPGTPGSVTVAVQGPGNGNSCPTDFLPAGSPDGATGIAELLAVIGAWGASGGSTDVSPAPCGDNVTGIADLLSIIGAWGACSS